MFGFLISLASFLSIKVTSPVTHSESDFPRVSPSGRLRARAHVLTSVISSAARGVLQTMLAVYFFGDVLSA